MHLGARGSGEVRRLLAAAAAADPVERLRWVATWFTAGLQHVFESWKKPFNPILGETWQAVQEDGSAIFMEQISHHPAISAFQMIGPGQRASLRKGALCHMRLVL